MMRGRCGGYVAMVLCQLQTGNKAFIMRVSLWRGTAVVSSAFVAAFLTARVQPC